MSHPSQPTASYDLHLHTYWSYDAAAHPATYFERAEMLEMRCIAITEHHVMDSLDEVAATARRYPRVRWAPGGEFTVNTSFGAVDLLCYGLRRPWPASLERVLRQYHDWQRAYGSAISRGLTALGLDYSDERRLELLKSYRPAKAIHRQGNTHVRNGTQRAHFIQKGFIANAGGYGTLLKQAAEKVPQPTYPEAADVVPVFRACGALVAMAHPHGHCPDADRGKLDALREECALDGLECAHTTMPAGLSPRFRDYCVACGMFSVAGSDCHLDCEVRDKFARHGGAEEWLDEFLARLPAE